MDTLKYPRLGVVSEKRRKTLFSRRLPLVLLATLAAAAVAGTSALASETESAATSLAVNTSTAAAASRQRDRYLELRQKYMTNRAISDEAYYVLLPIYALFVVFGTLGNSLICLTAILKPKILSPRNIFIINLATSDLLLCVFTMPFSFVEISMKMWHLGLVPCKLVAGLQATSIFVSTISITAIALDRYKVIVYPTQHESAHETRSAAILLVSVWIGALLLSLPLFRFRTVRHLELPKAAHSYASIDSIKSVDFCVEDWPFVHGRGIYSVVSMIVQYVLPITIVSIAYAKISDKLNKRLLRRQRLTQLECLQRRQKNLIRKTHTMLISVSIIFGLSWLPLNLLNVVGDFSDLFKGDDQLFRIVFAACHLIGCSSACSNPILYGYLNENFRKEFREVYTQHTRRVLRLLRCLGCAGGHSGSVRSGGGGGGGGTNGGVGDGPTHGTVVANNKNSERTSLNGEGAGRRQSAPFTSPLSRPSRSSTTASGVINDTRATTKSGSLCAWCATGANSPSESMSLSSATATNDGPSLASSRTRRSVTRATNAPGKATGRRVWLRFLRSGNLQAGASVGELESSGAPQILALPAADRADKLQAQPETPIGTTKRPKPQAPQQPPPFEQSSPGASRSSICNACAKATLANTATTTTTTTATTTNNAPTLACRALGPQSSATPTSLSVSRSASAVGDDSDDGSQTSCASASASSSSASASLSACASGFGSGSVSASASVSNSQSASASNLLSSNVSRSTASLEVGQILAGGGASQHQEPHQQQRHPQSAPQQRDSTNSSSSAAHKFT